MRYKMSSYISSVFPCLRFLLPMHIYHPLFILQSSKTLYPFSLLSLSPTHFTQNTFLSFILFPSASYSSHLSSSSLPLSVFWTFLLVLSVSLHPASPPSFPPSFLCDEWVCLLGAVHIYWAGERTLSVFLALHISIPPLKRQREQEVTVGWEEEGDCGQKIHFGSHQHSSWLRWEHVSLN